MNYKIKDAEGNEQGPANEETLIKWVKTGDISPETPMRNTLMGNWKTASDFAFLKEAFEAQKQEKENNKGLLQKALSDEPIKEKEKEPERTAFEYKYLPQPAGVPLRFLAALFDWTLIFVFTLFLWLIGSGIVYFSDINFGKAAIRMEEDSEAATDTKRTEDEEVPPSNNLEAETPPSKSDDERQNYKYGSIWVDSTTGTKYTCLNGAPTYAVWVDVSTIQSVFNKLFFIWTLAVLLYYGLGLGLYAQTFGMWFWGIFIAKREDVGEVFLLRAFAFTLLMPIVGIFTPIALFLTPKKCALQDLLSGTMIIRIAGKPKN
jgi:uncharacterized RDD family membrane protein YckC